MRRTIIIMSIALLMAMSTMAMAGESGSELAAVRRATVAFHDVSTAEDAGYQEFLDCFDSPSGGMGQHYVDLSALNDTVDPLHPEAMVYEVRSDGRLKLVAVEYIVPNAPPPAGQLSPPSLFGEQFHLNTTLNVWVLHVWIWQGNPTGVFEDWNPNIGVCP
jgi:hypothetical protein